MGISRPASDCAIEYVGKARNGSSRWWCMVHKANATGRGGTRLDVCEGAGSCESPVDILALDPRDYLGGVAVWRVSPPVYDTTGGETRGGVHVHARRVPGGEKEIDSSYDAVDITVRRDLLESTSRISARTASAYYIARFLGNRLKCLSCPRCGEHHLDEGHFAMVEHRTHLCESCGHYFRDAERAVSNPLVGIEGVEPEDRPGRFVQAPRALDIVQSDYPGGIRLWASNPAVIWTAERPEEQGVHVHVHSPDGDALLEDNTFGTVTIDSVAIDVDMVKQLMAQKTVPELTGRIASLRCPDCGTAHFDKGRRGLEPHAEHKCEHCGSSFPAERGAVVSNPICEVFDKLHLGATSSVE